MIDCHYHLDASMVAVPDLLASMDAAGVRKTALIPAMSPPLALPAIAGLVVPPFLRAIHGGGLLARGARAIYAAGVKRDGTVDVLGRRYRVTVQPDNAAVERAVKEHPDRFLGWVFVNPKGPADPVAEAERWLREPGMIGVKAHPFWHDYEVAQLLDVAAFCADKGAPILVHLGAGDHGDFRLLPERFPRLTVICAHAGIPYPKEVCEYARTKERVFVDLSCTAYVDAPAARAAVRRAGAAKCLFGTDGPYFHVKGGRFDYGYAARLLDGLGLSATDRDRVAFRNFEEIVGGA